MTSDSPTQRVAGKPLKEFKKVRHIERMTSFNDTFSEDDVRTWLTRLENYLGYRVSPIANRQSPIGEKVTIPDTRYPIPAPFYCELKIDGLAIELEYEDGVFVRGSTRGDGLVGEDVTQNLKTIEAIPLRLFDSAEVEKNIKKSGLHPTSYTLRPQHLIVRGEVFLTKKEFAKINKIQERDGLEALRQSSQRRGRFASPA